MQLSDKFNLFIKKENLFQLKDKFLLTVSGGVDSIVLCELFVRSNYDFKIAHCNFKLREEESDRDEQFVKELAKKYNKQIFIKNFETQKYADENKLGIQEAARILRYEWFYDLIENWSRSISGEIGKESPVAKWIVTAHHADDNIETVLMNFFKGTGINGLRAMLSKQDKIVRPLLFASKEEIKAFADENKLSYVEDSSNESDKYMRNYLRNQLIPSIQKIYPQVKENMQNNLARFRDIEMLYQQTISNYKKKLLEQKGNEFHIPVLKLLKTSPLSTIVFEIIKNFGFTAHQTGEVVNLLQSESGKYIQSSTYKIFKNRKWLIISPNNTSTAQNILIVETDKTIEYENGKLKIENVSAINYKLSTDINIAQVDADEIVFPLLLRKWKQGDYFYPLGMQKKKKLSKFFIDQKMSIIEKENAWVIEMNKKIIWIVRKRIDDRFKITDKTKNILKISLH